MEQNHALSNLSEAELKEAKQYLIENQIIIECRKIKDFDVKFFETVAISNTIIKYFCFFSMALYILINLAGIGLSIFNHTGNPIGSTIALFVICFIVFATFGNINTNKKKEENPLFIQGNNFIFNFTDDAVETPNLFYILPFDSVKSIEFIIHKLKKGQIFGSVTFTFNAAGYDFSHTIRFTNLSKIRNYLSAKFPTLTSCLIIDGKGEKSATIPTHHKSKLKYNLISLAILAFALLLVIIPYVLNFHSIALILSAIILFITAILSFLSSFLYTYHLVQGTLMSGIFIIIGFLVPLLVVEIDGISILDYISQNNEILLPTAFGIIGLCLYAYNFIIMIGKIVYKIKNKRL